MLILEKKKRILVLRVNNFHQYNFIDEHKKCLETSTYVWMLKAGRPLADKSLDEVIKDGGYLILKEPKGSGNRYYACLISEVKQGHKSDDMIHPAYYKELFADGISLAGTWLKISGIIEIDEAHLSLFELVKNKKQMTEIVSTTRSPILFVTTRETLFIKDVEIGKAVH